MKERRQPTGNCGRGREGRRRCAASSRATQDVVSSLDDKQTPTHRAPARSSFLHLHRRRLYLEMCYEGQMRRIMDFIESLVVYL